LRHAVTAARFGFNPLVRSVAELGPGDSLGIGLCALLSGAQTYYALDIKRHAAVERNVAVLDELVELFGRREPVPDDAEFPDVQPKLADYRFPSGLVPEAFLATALRPQRVACIRGQLSGQCAESDDAGVVYAAPWTDDSCLRPGAVDLVISQAVLEHVEDLVETYSALMRWLKPGGFMSHNIDFRSHGLTRDWYGHWMLSAQTWRLVKGTRPYLLNRMPYSTHVSILRTQGFEIRAAMLRNGSPLAREQLALRFPPFTDEDLHTQGALLIAAKPS
jgi:hypothetical protein